MLTVLGVSLSILLLAVIFGSDRKMSDTGLSLAQSEDVSSTATQAESEVAPTEAIASDPIRQVREVAATDAVQSEPVSMEDVENASIRYTKTAVNLREGPSTKFSVITVVPKGVGVSVVEVKGAWSQVRVNENTTGWMANSTISEP